MPVAPVLAHGGLSAGADNVATYLVIGAVVALAWFRVVQRRTPKGGRPRWLPLLPAAAVLMVGAAAVTPTFVSTTPSKTRPHSPARIGIVAPGTGAMVGRKVTIQLSLTGAKLAPLNQVQNGKLPADRGHIHILVDGQLRMIGGLEDHVDLGLGPHTVVAEFAAIDHGSFNPPVVASVTFTVA